MSQDPEGWSNGVPQTVRDLMQRTVVSISPSASIRELARLLRARGVSGVPVVADDGLVVGTVSVTDLTWLSDWFMPDDSGGRTRTRVADTLDERTVGEVMTPDVFGVAPDASLNDLAKFFARTGLHRAVVLEGGRLAGIVSITDLFGLVVEEIDVGEPV